MGGAGEESVGQRVRRLRLARGMTQRQLSVPGVSYAYVSRIESGERLPSLKVLRILARRLGVPLDYLETGARVPAAAERELRLGDAELELRLGRDLEKAERVFREELEEEEEPARAAWREADSAGALVHIHRAIGLLEPTEDTHNLALAHLLCAQLLNLDGRSREAGRHLEQAERLFVLGAEESDLGVLRAEQAKRAAALGHAEEALARAREAERLLGDDERHL